MESRTVALLTATKAGTSSQMLVIIFQLITKIAGPLLLFELVTFEGSCRGPTQIQLRVENHRSVDGEAEVVEDCPVGRS
jgi:hypothetical protein